MATIILQLNAAGLANPDSDIRYALPDALAARFPSLTADGYEYAGDPKSPCLLLFLGTEDVEKDSLDVISFLKKERVLGNDLAQIPVAFEDGEFFKVIHPPNFQDKFHYLG